MNDALVWYPGQGQGQPKLGVKPLAEAERLASLKVLTIIARAVDPSTLGLAGPPS